MLSATMLISIMFSSCDKDDVFNVKKNLIDKKWELTTVEADEFTQSMFDMMLSLVKIEYDFRADETYVVTTSIFGFGDKETGTWSISADQTQITIDGEVSAIIEAGKDVLKIGPSNAIMSNVDEEDEIEDDMSYVIVFEAQ